MSIQKNRLKKPMMLVAAIILITSLNTEAFAFRRKVVVKRPPVGTVVTILPVGHKRLVRGGVVYYSFKGVYYKKSPSGYIVVKKPKKVKVVKIPGNAVRVRPQALNVRSGPGRKHAVIQTVYKGEVLKIRGNAPGWLYVRLPSGTSGWVAQKFTTSAAPKG